MRGDDFRPNDFRQRANAVRSIPLADVLAKWGADRDRLDRNRWHTERGPVSITAAEPPRESSSTGICSKAVAARSTWSCTWAIATSSVAVRWLERHLGDPAATRLRLSLFHPPTWADRPSSISSRSFSGNANVKARSLCLPVAHLRQPPASPSLSDRAASSLSEYHPIADHVGKAVCGPTWERGLSDGGGKGSAADWRRVARHGAASLAWLGAWHSEGRGLFLDWRTGKLDFAFENNCALRIGD